MSSFFGPTQLMDLARVLAIVGVVGWVCVFICHLDRRFGQRALAVLSTVLLVGGAAMAWQADRLHRADRELSAEQQAALGQVIARFPDIRFIVMTQGQDKEAAALARKVVEAVKAGGATPEFHEQLAAPPKGVVLGIRDKAAPAARATDAIGRAVMVDRIAIASDLVPELDGNTMRILVGQKP
ncbi:MAG: hypothetical protein ISP45_17340 [Reyranella sp.]|nr:hypothetical protein [Reyranella sp.]